MKKYFYVLIAALCAAFTVQAGPGDTTWVQANNRYISHDVASTDWYGNYDTTVTFPDGNTSYRKIYMIYTMGKYPCPGGAQYCSQWDYTVQNYLMTPGGDTLELGRFITAFAGGGDTRFPANWAQHYVFDVTDYAAMLKNSATLRMFYSGYSGGFTCNIRFAFIEGTPERNVVGLSKLWAGSFGYGNASDPINNHFPVSNQTAPANTQSATLKFTVTGHGSDANQCCEFMSNNYQVFQNGNQIDQYTIWRDNCGLNEIYPQTGTWIFNRGNWCPGAMVYPNFHNLQNVTAGTSFTTDIQFDAYTSPNGGASYTTEGQIIYYGGINRTLDASIEEIISPTNNENYFRENPIEGKPQIIVRNSGSTPINSISFEYGIPGNWMPQYTWQGTLAPLHDTVIALPEIWDLYALAGTNSINTFKARITNVNGQADDNDLTNNTLTSYFTAAPIWPLKFCVSMLTNSTDVNGTDQTGQGGQSQTSWKIYNSSGDVIAMRTDAMTRTNYNDTLSLPLGWYKLVVEDGGCDGLNWWLEAQDHTDFPNYHAGSFTVKKVSMPGTIPLNGMISGGTYGSDFGCGFTQYFTVGWPLAITNLQQTAIEFKAYPNPAQNSVNVSFTGVQDVTGKIRIIDALGRVVLETPCTGTEQVINTSSLISGLYTMVYTDEKEEGHKLQTRLLITK